MKSIPIILCAIFILQNSCTNFKNNKDSENSCENLEIDSIKVWYYNYFLTEWLVPKKCDDLKNKQRTAFKRVLNASTNKYYIDYEGIIDTVIVDCVILGEIGKELKKLTPEIDSTYMDARISGIIYYKNGMQEEICISGQDQTSDIYYNGSLCSKNTKLLYLIKKNIGFYTWFYRDELDRFFEELKDTTFIREPILMTRENNPRVEF